MAATDQPIAQPFDFLSEQLHTKQRGLWAQAWQRLLRNRLAVAAGVILLVIAAVSFAADVSRTV